VGVLAVWESGQRFSVNSGREVAQAGALSLADYSGSRQVGDVYRRPNGVFYFLPEQTVLFTTPQPGGRGTSGRNSFTGPGYFNLDLALYKSFRLKKLGRLGLRGEIYNLFNGADFDIPGTNLANPVLFGRITSTQGTPRVVQIALRYEF